MASAGCSVVLRVKRKRTDDPAEALVLRSKIRKCDEDEEEAAAPRGEHVFDFCGTLPDQKELSTGAVMDLISKSKVTDRKPLKQSAFARLTISHHKDQQRALKKVSSTSQRYSLVARRRCMSKLDQQDETTQVIPSPPLPASQRLSELVQMYEVVQESSGSLDVSQTEEPSSSSNGSSLYSNGAITCNSSVMTREKVNVGSSDGFVYDIYYAKYGTMQDPDSLDWTSLSVYDQSPVLVHDVISSDEDHGESEEDSNDENHWKNDYPDEKEWSGDSTPPSLASLDDSYSNGGHPFRHREPFFDELDPFENDLSYHHLSSWQDSNGDNWCDGDSLEEGLS